MNSYHACELLTHEKFMKLYGILDFTAADAQWIERTHIPTFSQGLMLLYGRPVIIVLPSETQLSILYMKYGENVIDVTEILMSCELLRP
jgi:hypothetical protein